MYTLYFYLYNFCTKKSTYKFSVTRINYRNAKSRLTHAFSRCLDDELHLFFELEDPCNFLYILCKIIFCYNMVIIL